MVHLLSFVPHNYVSGDGIFSFSLVVDEVGEHHAVMCVVFPSPQLGTVDRSCKHQVESYPDHFFFQICFGVQPHYIGYIDQVTVFGALYAKGFLKPPQKSSPSEASENGVSSPVKPNP